MTLEEAARDAELVSRWAALLPGSPELGASLVAAYAAPNRRYHDLDHLSAVLDGVDVLAGEAADVRLVALAAWFHDAVYDVQAAAGSEELSAAWAEAALPSTGLARDEVAEVARLVRLTASHAPEPGDANGSVLCDADLAILASSTHAYAAYTTAVREEYAHVGDPDFRAGRAAILEQLLAMPSLYGTVYGRMHWERDARLNLKTELTRLQ